MCGIFGVWNYKEYEPVNPLLIKESTRIISHRGPDGERFYIDQHAGLAFGHRRLSILDLSTGDQPMCNEDETVWITFNGEIYNYLDIKEELLKKGHIFKTRSDTEVIIHAYEEYGEEFPDKLNGIFAFAIWDSKKKLLMLARDHFGIKPLYYLIDNKQIIFSSEIKAILNYSQMIPGLDLHALNLCLTFRHTPAPYTLFSGIKKLPATYYLILKNNNFEIKYYWDRKIEINHTRSEKEWIEILRKGFELAVKRQMMSDVPVGISLSGGVDSGAILALMNRFAGTGIHAFTIGFEGGRKEDSEIGRAGENAKMFGANFHYRIINSVDYSNFLEKYIWHLEEPLGNESAVAVYFVTEMAKGIVKVLLNGQGADEPFGGYDRYFAAYYKSKYPFISERMVKAILLLPVSLSIKRKLIRFSDFLAQDSDIKKITSAACILTKMESADIFSRELLSHGMNSYTEEIEKILISEIDGNTVEKMFVYDMFSSLSENLLLVQDKMAMASGIEGRVPFLDIDFARKALSIPAHLKIRNKSGKLIHKKVCEAYLPKSIVYQRKIGFQDPVDLWLKDSLGEELMDYVNSEGSVTKSYLNIKKINEMYHEHKNNIADNKRFLYLLLSIEKWADIFITNRTRNNKKVSRYEK